LAHPLAAAQRKIRLAGHNRIEGAFLLRTDYSTMSYAISTTDQFPFQRFLLYSVFLHLGLPVIMLAGVWLQRSGNQWGIIGGDGDSGFKVNIVAPAGIPMLQPTNVTDSGVVDPTKSLHRADPLPPAPEIKPETATEIPKWTRERPLRPSRPSIVFEKKTPDADNAVPGKEGSASIPSGYTNTRGPIYGGLAVRGEGGGDFAGRYPWYVQSVVRAISQNWMQNTIDPTVRATRRAKTTVTFSINRDGSVKNIRIIGPSGNRSMDDSAQRAILSIDHYPPLPPDYSGRYVDVIFDFDLGMTR
jgi:TonB family protein